MKRDNADSAREYNYRLLEPSLGESDKTVLVCISEGEQCITMVLVPTSKPHSDQIIRQLRTQGIEYAC